MPMAMFTRVNGKMIRLMDSAAICTLTELNMKDIGRRTNSMAKVRRLGLMALSMKETMLMAKKTERAASDGLMAPLIKANSLITISTAKVFISGPILANIMVSGKITRCTERECSLGLMGENMRVTTMMIKSKAMAFSPGLMVADTTASGSMASSTERVLISHLREKSSAENGKMARELDGLMSEQVILFMNFLYIFSKSLLIKTIRSLLFSFVHTLN